MRKVLVLVLIIVVLVLSACGGGSGDSREARDAEASTGSTAATGDRSLVSGTGICDFTSEVTTESEQGRVTVYKAAMACKEQMSDPRVSGRDEFELSEARVVGRDPEDLAWFRCDKQTLTTKGGTWRGACYGSEFTDPDDGGLYTSGYTTLVGEGAYEGLVYHLLFAQSPEADHYLYAGWIESVE